MFLNNNKMKSFCLKSKNFLIPSKFNQLMKRIYKAKYNNMNKISIFINYRMSNKSDG
jgi:hypothetical protein